jgi:spore maturation protein CgeB
MKILYAGGMALGSTSRMRRLGLERLGHDVVGVDSDIYRPANKILRKLQFELSAGPLVEKLNRDLLRMAQEEKPDVFWADKQLYLQPKTLEAMNEMGIATVSWMIDNPFGPRRDTGWRLYLKDLPLFDLHAQQRDTSLVEYKRRGAKDVVKILIGFEPTVHFPSPEPITDAERTREVSFMGMPYDDRGEIVTKLVQAGIPVSIYGKEPYWKKALDSETFAKVYKGGEMYVKEYREGFWYSKINLSFVTKSNQDEVTQKSFEIAACGGLLMAERTAGHQARFVEGEEAVFFSDTDELIGQIKRYLPDEAARQRIAAAGRERAVRDGYDNNHQLSVILQRLEPVIQAKRAMRDKKV